MTLSDVIRKSGYDEITIGLLLILFVDRAHPEIIPDFAARVKKSFGDGNKNRPTFKRIENK